MNPRRAALALLRSVETARTRHASLKATFSLDGQQCVVEMDGSRRRFEIDAANVTLIDGDKLFAYVRQDGQDLCAFDMSYAVGVRGCDAFDPRILGLSAELLPASLTVRDCLWYPWADKLELIANEELDGVRVAHVRAIRDDVKADYWIEEATARLYRTTMHDLDAEIQTEVASEFDAKDRRRLFRPACARSGLTEVGPIGIELSFPVSSSARQFPPSGSR